MQQLLTTVAHAGITWTNILSQSGKIRGEQAVEDPAFAFHC